MDRMKISLGKVEQAYFGCFTLANTIFKAALFLIAKNRNIPNVHQQVNGQTVAYPCNGTPFSGKRNEALTHAEHGCISEQPC